MDEKDFRILFADIVKGYTLVKNLKFGDIFIKHLNSLDLANIDDEYNKYYEKAVSEGALIYKDQEKKIFEDGSWTQNEENEIKNQTEHLSHLSSNLSKEYLKSKREIWHKEIKVAQNKIDELIFKKAVLIGDTAETFADKKSNEYYIRYCFYSDKELQLKKFIDDEEFDDLEPSEIKQIFEIYHIYSRKFVIDSIKKISISSFFIKSFSTCLDNPQIFYGIPSAYLTFHQLDLFTYGRYYKNVLSEFGDGIPSHILNNPNELMEWVEANRNYNKLKESNQNAEAESIVGAKKEDLTFLGLNPKASDDLSKELKKKGKLTMKDLLEIQ